MKTIVYENELEQIAYENGLEVIQTTCEKYGYPRNLRYAILVDEDLDWEDIEEVANQHNLEIIKLYRSEGQELWGRCGTAYELYDGTRNPEFNDDTRFFEGGDGDDFWEREQDTLAELLRESDRQEFIDLVDHYKDIADAADNLDASEFIAYTQYKYDTYPKRTVSLVGDTQHWGIGLIEK